MHISDITDKQQWEDFVISNQSDSFLHSWNWGVCNEQLPQKIWRWGIWDNQNLIAVALIIFTKAKRGNFLFIPHGPIIQASHKPDQIFTFLLEHLKLLGKQEKADFIRISPTLPNTAENKLLFQKLKFRPAPIHMMHPENTWILDIQPSTEILLKNMRKNHRNLIRKATKEQVTILKGDTTELLQEFYNIHLETVRRHNFTPFSLEYMKKELQAFAPDKQVMVLLAKYQEHFIASAIIIFYGNEAFYHHGASSSKFHKIPASYLVLFEAIQEAKNRNLTKFNFYGIVDNKPKHPWYGLSQFKKGFGGQPLEFLHCQDFPLTAKYTLTYLVETIRKIKRGY